MTHLNSKIAHYGPFIARLLIAILFFISGISTLLSFKSASTYFTSTGIPLAAVFVAVIVLVNIVASLMLATGIHAREGAWALIAFVVLAIALPQMGNGQLLSNIAIIGGLLMIVVHGAGPLSLGKKCPCNKCKKGDSAGVCEANIATDTCVCGVCDTCTGKNTHSQE